MDAYLRMISLGHVIALFLLYLFKFQFFIFCDGVLALRMSVYTCMHCPQMPEEGG